MSQVTGVRYGSVTGVTAPICYENSTIGSDSGGVDVTLSMSKLSYLVL